MADVARHETDSIMIEMEVDGPVVQIKMEIKDEEVFTPIDWSDKKARSLIVDQAANMLKGLLNLGEQFSTQQRDRKGKMIPVTCKGCGEVFKTEEPCCGEKAKQILCPHCKKPQLLTRVK